MKKIALVLALGVAACGAPKTSPTVEAQQAVYALEEAYNVATTVEIQFAKTATPAQVEQMKKLDAEAYPWVVSLRVEAQNANVIAADLAAGQAAVAALTTLVKGAH